MIHTFSMYTNLEMENIEICSEVVNADYNMASHIISNKSKGFTANISKQYGGWKLFLTVDVIKLLGRSDINEKDYHQTQNIINDFSMHYFGEILNFILTRIEYRHDALLDKAEREFLVRRYKKIIDKYYFAKKNIYGTSVYHSNKSKSKIIYDKESEREAKGMVIESYEKDILRYEVKLLRSHLAYQKRTYDIDRTLENYWKYDIYRKYFTKEFKPILYSGDYYKLYDIIKILDSSNLWQKDKEGIKIFLNKTSKFGISKAKEDYTNYIFNKYIGILETLDINPIVIPKNEKDLPNNKYIKNPISDLFV